MSLKLLNLDLEDFNTMIEQAGRFMPGDDLVGPPTPICWHVTTKEQAQQRLQFHMLKQRERFRGDPSARFIKVIDDDTKEIVSIARWHFYPRGYSYVENIHWEIYDRTEGHQIPREMNVDLYNFILSSRDNARSSWMDEGKPCWILTHLVTRVSQRGRGAARMLINWGITHALYDNVPAYLEAGNMAQPIYEKLGFRQIGDLISLNLRPFGIETDFVMAKMGINHTTTSEMVV